jgi:hypothetical protein
MASIIWWNKNMYERVEKKKYIDRKEKKEERCEKSSTERGKIHLFKRNKNKGEKGVRKYIVACRESGENYHFPRRGGGGDYGLV